MILQEYAAYPASPLVPAVASQALAPGGCPIQSAPFGQSTNFISFPAPGNAFYYTQPGLPATVIATNGVILYFAIDTIALMTTNVGFSGLPQYFGNGTPVVGSGPFILSVGAGQFISFVAVGVTPYAVPQ